jgi:hypothetical protein
MAAHRVAAVDALPKWTKRAATDLSGRDPLGLSRVAQMLADGLLPGIITQTDRARYYALYCWILWHIEREDRPDGWQTFVASFQRRGAAIALATTFADGANHALSDAGCRGADVSGSPAYLHHLASDRVRPRR